MQMLADKIVELGVVDEPVSHDTARRVLQKTTLNHGSKNSGVSPQ